MKVSIVPVLYKYHAKSTQGTVPSEYHLVLCRNSTKDSFLSTIPGTAPQQYEGQHHCSTVHIDLGKPQVPATRYSTQHSQLLLSGPPHLYSYHWQNDKKQVNLVQVHPETSCKALREHCMHVHQPAVQVCKPGESLALRKSSTHTTEGLL